MYVEFAVLSAACMGSTSLCPDIKRRKRISCGSVFFFIEGGTYRFVKDVLSMIFRYRIHGALKCYYLEMFP